MRGTHPLLCKIRAIGKRRDGALMEAIEPADGEADFAAAALHQLLCDYIQGSFSMGF